MFYYFKYYVILTSSFTQGASLCSTKSEKCYQSKMPLQPPEILCFNEHRRSLWDVFTCWAGLAGPGFLSWEGSRSTGHTEGATGVGLLTCRAVLRGKNTNSQQKKSNLGPKAVSQRGLSQEKPHYCIRSPLPCTASTLFSDDNF